MLRLVFVNDGKYVNLQRQNYGLIVSMYKTTLNNMICLYAMMSVNSGIDCQTLCVKTSFGGVIFGSHFEVVNRRGVSLHRLLSAVCVGLCHFI